jgi:prolyl oligopeptidase
MGKSMWVLLILVVLTAAAQQTSNAPTHPSVASVRPVTEELYGVKVTDPYRYMENLKDPPVDAWFRQQDLYTRSVLAGIPGRDALLADIKKYDQSAPALVTNVIELPGGVYFYQKVLAQQNVPKLYMRQRLSGAERLLFDPAKFENKGGPHWAISYYTPSFDGRYVAIGVSPGGSEDAVLHVIDVLTGRETGETITRTRFNHHIYWRPDSQSFFYNRMQELAPGAPATEEEEKSRVYLHVVGTDAGQDRAVLGYGVSLDVPVGLTDLPRVWTDPESSYALGILWHGVQKEVTVYVAPVNALGKGDTPWKKIISVSDEVSQSILEDLKGLALHGDELYLVTYHDAPRLKVVRMSLSHPDLSHGETVLPQSETVVESVAAAKDSLYVQELDGGIDRLLRIPYDAGKPEAVQLPLEGALSIDSADTRLPGLVFELTSWTKASAIYQYDADKRVVSDTHLQPDGPYSAPTDIESVEVKVPSYDGTAVPLSIVHKRGLKLDGTNPTLLDAYGAYGFSSPPGYDPTLLAWYGRGGVFAEAHVRGGGEYGEDWHKAGYKLTKPNTWRDFIACAEYLIEHKYTSPQRLAISGASAGGIGVGRFITERPDLVAAAIDEGGILNPLRIEAWANGVMNVPEFGSTKTQTGFEDLYAMDSYQHVRDGVQYPALLLTTGWNDPRVASWQPGKMAARLQGATSSKRPVLLRVDYSAGHGFGSTKEQTASQLADEWSFVLWQLGMPAFQPPK